MRDSEADFKVLSTLPTLCYNSSTRFPEFLLLDDLLCCLCDLSLEYFDTHSFFMSIIGLYWSFRQ